MGNFLAFPISQIPYLVVALAIAFSVHEFSHALVAYKFGDPTAEQQGRLTLSPLAHLDILGTLLIFIAGFGWAKPVPVNRHYFKKPRLAGFLVSVMGPLSNLLLTILAFFAWYVLYKWGVVDTHSQLSNGLYEFLNLFIYLNVMLFIFNLLPFPPLDGYRMVEDLVAPKIRASMVKYENYGSLIFLILVLTPLDQYTITPIINVAVPYLVQMIGQFFTI